MKTVRPQAKTAGGPLNPLSVPLTCRLQFKGVEDASAQAVIGGDELPCLRLALDLQPSSAPQAIVLLQGDKEVPIQVAFGGTPCCDHLSRLPDGFSCRSTRKRKRGLQCLRELQPAAN